MLQYGYSQQVFGGTGNDQIFNFGDIDAGFGGTGGDEFFLSADLADVGIIRIEDFKELEDFLIVMHPDDHMPDPSDVSLVPTTAGDYIQVFYNNPDGTFLSLTEIPTGSLFAGDQEEFELDIRFVPLSTYAYLQL